ncbi:MAG: hypothetical protein IIZ67_00355 [Bacilli bacterium]|nr:hypothetical protein [Bacilli bacterium]
MERKKVSYVERESEDGSFSPHIYDKKLIKKLETVCMATGTNRTHYVIDAIRDKVEKDLKKVKSQCKELI